MFVKVVMMMMINGDDDDDSDDVTGERNLQANSTWVGATPGVSSGQNLEPEQIFQHNNTSMEEFARTWRWL